MGKTRNLFQENYSAMTSNHKELEKKKKKQQSYFYVPRWQMAANKRRKFIRLLFTDSIEQPRDF